MKAKVGKTANILLRLLIIVLSFWFVYHQLVHHRSFSEVFQQFKQLSFESARKELQWLVLLLMPINIALESFKWKLLIDKLEKVSFNRAFTAVLSGISVSMIMPNRVGDFLGRVFILQKESHIKGILVTLIGSVSQTLTTFLAGSIAFAFSTNLFLDFETPLNESLRFGILLVIFLLLIFSILLYFNVGLVKFVAKGIFPRRHEKLHKYIDVFTLYSQLELLKILSLSILRFLVYTLQYYLLLLICGFEIDYLTAMMFISMTYVLLTIVPTVVITELSIRGSIAIYLFGLYFSNTAFWEASGPTAVFTASSVLWVLNLIIPALFGIIFVYRLRFFRKQDLNE